MAKVVVRFTSRVTQEQDDVLQKIIEISPVIKKKNDLIQEGIELLAEKYLKKGGISDQPQDR